MTCWFRCSKACSLPSITAKFDDVNAIGVGDLELKVAGSVINLDDKYDMIG